MRGVALPPILPQQLGPQFVEQGLDRLAVAQRLAQARHQFSGDIHTASAALVGEGEDERGMFVAAGAGRAIGPDTGFADLGQGALDGGPEPLELAQEVLSEGVVSGI